MKLYLKAKKKGFNLIVIKVTLFINNPHIFAFKAGRDIHIFIKFSFLYHLLIFYKEK